MKSLIFIFITVIFIFSGCIMQEPEKFDDIKHPEPCFQNGSTFENCTGDYSAPLPSDYALAILPKGLPLSLNFPNNYPLNLRLTSPIDENTLKDGLFVLRAESGKYTVLKSNEYLIQFGEFDKTTFKFNDDKTFLNILPLNEDSTLGSWKEGATYIVVLTKELKDINGLSYAKPAAFFMAASTFEITIDIVKSLDPNMSEEEAEASVKALLAMREGLKKPFQLIDALLNKTKFDVSFLWSFTFNNQTVCFNSTNIKNCENELIPRPSDFMSVALPENTNLNITQKSKFSISFSEDVHLHSFINNLTIVKKSLENNDTPEIIPSEDIFIEFDSENHKKILISNKKEKWDSRYTYIIYLKKGIFDSEETQYLPSMAFFFSTLEDALIDETGKLSPVLITLGFKQDNPQDIETATALEGLRQFNIPLISLAETMNIAKKEELLMIWTITVSDNIIIPCFNSSEVAGCENKKLAPLPSDFIMAYEEDGSHHINLPIDENASDIVKAMITAINTLDGWSTTKGFTLNLSGELDSSTINTDLANSPTIMVLKIADKTGQLSSPTPIAITTNFNNKWNQLNINPIMRKWDESSTYLIVLTNKIKGLNNETLVKPITFSLMSEENSLVIKDEEGNIISSKYSALNLEEAIALEEARLQFAPVYTALEAIGITRDTVSMMWTVTTQSVTDETQNMRNFVLANHDFPDYMELDPAKTIPNSSFPAVFPGINLSNVSVIAYGNFKAPIFLSELNSPYMGAFDPNKFPVDNITPPITNAEIKKLPFLVAFPNPENDVTLPVASNKIIIFQHGFTRDKNDVLPLLNILTAEGYIVISYDMPFHGDRTITDGSSGDGFISLNVFASRDNIRQSVLEQVKLIKTLKTINFADIDSTNLIEFSTINPNEIYYIGHSMGTFVGNILFSIEDSVKAAVLNVAGAKFTELLMTTTDDIKLPIIEQLEALDIIEGTPEFEEFIYLAQTAVEKGDSINYKRGNNDNILIQESLHDPVITNKLTRDLGVAQGFIDFTNNDIIKANNYKSYFVDAYIEKVHSFILLNTNVTNEARTDIINFFENAQ